MSFPRSAYAADDVSPPTLVGLTFSSTTIDTSAAPATVDIDVNVTDDLTGVTTVSVMMINATTFESMWTTGSLVSGTALNGTWRHSVFFPQGSAPGTWVAFTLPMVDGAGNSSTLDLSALIASGFPFAVQNGPPTVPERPYNLVATRGPGSATVEFVSSALDGGSPITGYSVTCTSSNGGLTGTASGTASPITVGNLTNGKTYTCTAQAANAVGSSIPSLPSPTLVPATVPDPPSNLVASRGDASVQLTFTAPSDGGDGIIGYTATCTSSTGGTAGSSSSIGTPSYDLTSIYVGGLTNGETYTCTATATNRVGTSSASSASNSVIPSGCSTLCVSVADASILEGDSGARVVTFLATLSRPSPNPVTVEYRTVLQTGPGFATGTNVNASGADYRVKPRSRLTFPPNTIQKKIGVRVFGDATIESDETLLLQLLGTPTGVFVLGRGEATGTVRNDDGLAPGVTLGVDDGQIVGSTSKQILRIPVRLSAPAGVVTVNYVITPGTATFGVKATSGGDFGGKLTGTLTFTGTATLRTIPVAVWANTGAEDDKSFSVALSIAAGTGVTLLRPNATQTLLGQYY